MAGFISLVQVPTRDKLFYLYSSRFYGVDSLYPGRAPLLIMQIRSENMKEDFDAICVIFLEMFPYEEKNLLDSGDRYFRGDPTDMCSVIFNLVHPQKLAAVQKEIAEIQSQHQPQVEQKSMAPETQSGEVRNITSEDIARANDFMERLFISGIRSAADFVRGALTSQHAPAE